MSWRIGQREKSILFPSTEAEMQETKEEVFTTIVDSY